jgi:hypothetical protein
MTQFRQAAAIGGCLVSFLSNIPTADAFPRPKKAPAKKGPAARHISPLSNRMILCASICRHAGDPIGAEKFSSRDYLEKRLKKRRRPIITASLQITTWEKQVLNALAWIRCLHTEVGVAAPYQQGIHTDITRPGHLLTLWVDGSDIYLENGAERLMSLSVPGKGGRGKGQQGETDGSYVSLQLRAGLQEARDPVLELKSIAHEGIQEPPWVRAILGEEAWRIEAPWSPIEPNRPRIFQGNHFEVALWYLTH